MIPTDLQRWLATHGQPVAPDGQIGPSSRAAIVAAFTNPAAPAITPADLTAFASRLGCSTAQLHAVALVESGGSAFDKFGRPKLLFERHLFHRATGGKWSIAPYSNPTGGGYYVDSWFKLTHAAAMDPEAAFASASWGRFQVLGCHAAALGYPSALEMAWSTVASEAAHYELLCRYLEHNRMIPALCSLSAHADDNRAFAKGYNGAGYERFDYHSKLARAFA